MWAFIVLGLLVLFLCFYKGDETPREERDIAEQVTFDYCGGNENIVQDCKVDLTWFTKENRLIVRYYKFRDILIESIPYDKILKVYAKTESQIRSDVTLTRLAIFGIFAFGMKKDRKADRKFIVVKYLDEDNVEQDLILGGIESGWVLQVHLDRFKKCLESYRAKAAKEELIEGLVEEENIESKE